METSLNAHQGISPKSKSTLPVFLSRFRRFTRAELKYLDHYRVTFKSDLLLEQRTTLNSQMLFLTNAGGTFREL